jgi:Transposase zinc-ribbon domain
VQINITNLIDDGQCYQTVRGLRWPDGVKCPSCQSTQVIKRGFDDTEPALRIPVIPATQSSAKLPPNPVEACHPIQTKAATPSERSDAWVGPVTLRRCRFSPVSDVFASIPL